MNKKRAGFLDEVRGFAIICMVVYHAMYALWAFYRIDTFFMADWFDVIRDIFAGAFIFISGIVCRYSRNNLKRGTMCFFLGMIATFATSVIMAGSPILFGILHFLGISMMLVGLCENLLDFLPAPVGIAVSSLLFMFTWDIGTKWAGIATQWGTVGVFGIPALSVEIPREVYSNKLLFPLGFNSASFFSADYFPLMPWLFLFLAGVYFGVYVKNGDCPRFFYTTRVPFLAAIGRHTIWVYLLHMPALFGIFYLVFGGFGTAV